MQLVPLSKAANISMEDKHIRYIESKLKDIFPESSVSLCREKSKFDEEFIRVIVDDFNQYVGISPNWQPTEKLLNRLITSLEVFIRASRNKSVNEYINHRRDDFHILDAISRKTVFNALMDEVCKYCETPDYSDYDKQIIKECFIKAIMIVCES